jgi:hypothetical protein
MEPRGTVAAEFQILFADDGWLARNREDVEQELRSLPIFTSSEGNEIRLLGLEDRDAEWRWSYDVRLFLNEEEGVLMEVSAHPPSVEEYLGSFLSWLRSRTDVRITDEDGEVSGW